LLRGIRIYSRATVRATMTNTAIAAADNGGCIVFPFGSRHPEAGPARFHCAGLATWLAGLAALRCAIQAVA